MNKDLYVNVGEVLDLLECIETRSNHPKVTETVQEIVNVIHDLNWIEMTPDEVKIAKNREYKSFEVSKRIREVFNESGIPYTKIAKRLGLARSMIYKYIDEGTTPSAENIANICKEFNVTADYLLFGE